MLGRLQPVQLVVRFKGPGTGKCLDLDLAEPARAVSEDCPASRWLQSRKRPPPGRARQGREWVGSF